MSLGFPAQLALSIACVIVALVLHELAHGAIAYALGDRTAQSQGRLSLNPLRHVDRFGTILLPGFLAVSQLLLAGRVLFTFGWAKPVPVDPRAFRHPRWGMALVAAGGPATNFTLAFLTAFLFRWPGGLPPWADWLATEFMALNIVLGLFNLIPLPPLDGSRIIAPLLPAAVLRVWDRAEGLGLLLVLALVAAPPLAANIGLHLPSLGDLLGPLVDRVGDAMLRAANTQ